VTIAEVEMGQVTKLPLKEVHFDASGRSAWSRTFSKAWGLVN